LKILFIIILTYYNIYSKEEQFNRRRRRRRRRSSSSTTKKRRNEFNRTIIEKIKKQKENYCTIECGVCKKYPQSDFLCSARFGVLFILFLLTPSLPSPL
jgi:hypothetical protein